MDCGIRQFRMITLPQRLLEPPQRIAGPDPRIREQPAQRTTLMQYPRNCIMFARPELTTNPIHRLQSRKRITEAGGQRTKNGSRRPEVR
jgi:hypothetical protein